MHNCSKVPALAVMFVYSLCKPLMYQLPGDLTCGPFFGLRSNVLNFSFDLSGTLLHAPSSTWAAWAGHSCGQGAHVGRALTWTGGPVGRTGTPIGGCFEPLISTCHLTFVVASHSVHPSGAHWRRRTVSPPWATAVQLPRVSRYNTVSAGTFL